MNIDLFDINKFVKVNNLKEVTDPVVLERDNIPSINGLLSYEIFGRSTNDRSTTFAYIELGGHFINPIVYLIWVRLDRKIEAICAGIETFSINGRGQIVKDPDGWTGIEELYNHFDEIKFPNDKVNDQKERARMMKNLKKDEIFITKWIICPPFYRDLQLNKSTNGRVSYHEKTKIYADILRATKTLTNDFSGLEIVGMSTRNRIQRLLVQCCSDYFMKDIKGKSGMFRKYIMGKSVDYGARLVISTPMFDADKIEDMPVSFEYSGVPLATLCTNFFPYFVKWLKDFFYKEIYLVKDKYPVNVKNENGEREIKYIKLLNVEQFNDEYFNKQIDSFIHSYGDRFRTIPLENDAGLNIKLSVKGQYRVADNENKSTINTGVMDATEAFNRPITWTELLYIAACDICKDKHVLISRYPIEHYFSIFSTRITVMSTIKTRPAIISGRFYKYYPVVDYKLPPSEVANLFVDTLNISNLYLKGLDGDRVIVSLISDNK